MLTNRLAGSSSVSFVEESPQAASQQNHAVLDTLNKNVKKLSNPCSPCSPSCPSLFSEDFPGEKPSVANTRISGFSQEFLLSEVCRSWWNPNFKSEELEKRYRSVYFNQRRRRTAFQLTLFVTYCGMIAWALNNYISEPHRSP
eukprot:Sdes_comp9699_c0_seq1m1196